MLINFHSSNYEDLGLMNLTSVLGDLSCEESWMEKNPQLKEHMEIQW